MLTNLHNDKHSIQKVMELAPCELFSATFLEGLPVNVEEMWRILELSWKNAIQK